MTENPEKKNITERIKIKECESINGRVENLQDNNNIETKRKFSLLSLYGLFTLDRFIAALPSCRNEKSNVLGYGFVESA